MTKSNIPKLAHSGPRWQQESPGRHSRTTEADAHESAVERFSTLVLHNHDYQVTVVNLVPQRARCTLCGHPQDCAVCRKEDA